jgi:hypothetical protein
MTTPHTKSWTVHPDQTRIPILHIVFEQYIPYYLFKTFLMWCALNEIEGEIFFKVSAAD